MPLFLFRFIACFLLLLPLAVFSQIDYKAFPEWTWHRQDSTEYYLYTPKGMKADSVYPIALFLHGCCGESYRATKRNTVDPPVRMWHQFGANRQTIPTYIVAPATSRGWAQHIANLKKVIDSLVQFRQGDPQRIYITGFSMGGQGTWEFLQRYPGFFAAAIPMGMNFHGDHKTVKDIPIWTLRGETDYWANKLHDDVWKIRKLNGVEADSNQNMITGVNPRYTSFRNYGHGVQWVAAGTMDLTSWAYGKINDGNNYPVVHFVQPVFGRKVRKGEKVKIALFAEDNDGTVSKIAIRVNGRAAVTLFRAPYTTTITAPAGDALIEATAYDNRNKASTAVCMIRADVPATFESQVLPLATKGDEYRYAFRAAGNGPLRFGKAAPFRLPAGLRLDTSGVIAGMPEKEGAYLFYLTVTDVDGDTSRRQFRMDVQPKKPETVLVTNVRNRAGICFPVAKFSTGKPVHFDNGDDEVTVSDPSGFEGYTYILTSNQDTTENDPAYLQFDMDEDATVYVALEKKDHLFTSGTPAWLKGWEKATSRQIVTQYFYYDVYRKKFPKGTVSLPSPDRKSNSMNNNYFVLISRGGIK